MMRRVPDLDLSAGRHAAPTLPRTWPLALLLTAAVTTVSIQMSLTSGRLALLPTNDDADYMTSALHLLDVLAREGIGAFLLAALGGEHHSAPFSALGALGYLTFGIYDIAPYLALTPLLFLAFHLILRTLVRERDLAAVVLAILIATLPMFQFAAGEFRPDFFWGMFLGYGAFRLLDEWLTAEVSAENRTSSPWLAGGIFALGIILKPTALVASAAVLVGSILVLIATAVLFVILRRGTDGLRGSPELRHALRLALKFIAIVMSLSAPFLTADLAHIYDYTVRVLVVERERWGPALDIYQTIWFYPRLLGKVFSYGLNIFLVVWSAGLIVAMVKRDPAGFCRWIGVFGLIAVGYVIPTAPRNKTIFLGATFYGMILWTMVFGYPQLKQLLAAVQSVLPAKPLLRQIQRSNGLIALFAACASIGLLTRPLSLNAVFNVRPQLIALDADHRSTLAATLRLVEMSDTAFIPFEPTVYVNTYGPIQPKTLEYEALKRGITIHISGDRHSGDLLQQTAEASAADVAILPRSDAFGLRTRFNGTQIVDGIAEAISADPTFIGLDNRAFGVPPRVRIFVKVSTLISVEARNGWSNPRGSRRGMVRRMTGLSADLVLRSPSAIAGVATLECRSAAGVKLELLVDDEAAASSSLGDDFQAIRAPVALSAGTASVLSIRIKNPPSDQSTVDCAKASVEPVHDAADTPQSAP